MASLSAMVNLHENSARNLVRLLSNLATHGPRWEYASWGICRIVSSELDYAASSMLSLAIKEWPERARGNSVYPIEGSWSGFMTDLEQRWVGARGTQRKQLCTFVTTEITYLLTCISTNSGDS